jgi:hypothetical protein
MKKVAVIIGALLVLVSCGKEESSIQLVFSGVNTSQKSAQVQTMAEVNISDFRLSFRDVEFKKDESDLDSTEVQFRGPYDTDMLSETDALSQTIGETPVEAGTYKVLRFKLHKSRDRDPSHPLYDRSVFMSGTIDGVPFEFWHDTSENFDVENSDGITVADNMVSVVVRFNIDDFLSSVHNIDLSLAVDENQDGTIEINPDDGDGNKAIADQLKENIKMAADLIKE